MLRHLDPTKIERHSETHILNFLLAATKPAGAGSRYGNVNGKRDLVLHLGETADTPVAVVLEVKGPKNPAEMLTPEDLNRKAFQQLLLYYLEDRSDERTRLQAALFREKRALMEHALFGVDLNPNSVRICRLRLWIELLKHAYYKPETDCRELETLPNLDLNVKAGNSLLARFALDADLSEVFQKGKFSLREYRAAVHQYFGSRGRDDKNTLLGFFQQLKEQFTAVLHKRDKKREALRLARNQRTVLETQVSLLPETKKQEEIRYFEMKRLELLAQQLDAEIKTHEQGASKSGEFPNCLLIFLPCLSRTIPVK